MTEHHDKFLMEIVTVCNHFFSDLNNVCAKYLPTQLEGGGKISEDKDVPEKKKKSRREREKERDPDAPRKPTTSPWILFYNDRRIPLKREHPGISRHMITRMASKEWHDLPDDKKKPYADKVKKNLNAYKEKLIDYTKKLDEKAKNEQHANDLKLQKNVPVNNNVLESSDDEKNKDKSVKKPPVESNDDDDEDDDDDDNDSDDDESDSNSSESSDNLLKKPKNSETVKIEPKLEKKVKRN